MAKTQFLWWKISNYFELESIVFPPVTVCPLYNENVDEASRLSGKKTAKKISILSIPKSQRYHWNLSFITIIGIKVFNSDNFLMHFCIRNAQVTFVFQTTVKNN